MERPPEMTRTGAPGMPWEELEIKLRDLGEQTAPVTPDNSSTQREQFIVALQVRNSYEQELLVVGGALMSGSPDETGVWCVFPCSYPDHCTMC